MLTYDPRLISGKVYRHLQDLKSRTQEQAAQKEQKNQAVELYNYVATWGLLRLKAEEFALSQENKRLVVACFFQTLQEILTPEPASNSDAQPPRSAQPTLQLNRPNRPGTSQSANGLLGEAGLNYLTTREASEYLGLTGLALQVAREFAFWAEAIYPKSDK